MRSALKAFCAYALALPYVLTVTLVSWSGMVNAWGTSQSLQGRATGGLRLGHRVPLPAYAPSPCTTFLEPLRGMHFKVLHYSQASFLQQRLFRTVKLAYGDACSVWSRLFRGTASALKYMTRKGRSPEGIGKRKAPEGMVKYFKGTEK